MPDSKDDDRIITASTLCEDSDAGSYSRPESLDDFEGQRDVCENLRVFIDSARSRSEAMDHTLFFGPPGLGKTTLAGIVAKELGVGFRSTSGPVITKAGDLAALLTNLQRNDVLFIDEIHRLSPAIEEILYPAMEDFQLDLIIGEGPSARSVRIDLEPFTLVAATTRAGVITTPLRERFGIPLHLNYYSVDELSKIVFRGARLIGFNLLKAGAHQIAMRSRGTPRVAGRLLRRVRDFCTVDGLTSVDKDSASRALMRLDIDEAGLDKMDRSYLFLLGKNYLGGPVGVDTIATSLGNERDVIEDVVEPFLIQQGFLQRSPRGRMLTASGWSYIGLIAPKGFFGDKSNNSKSDFKNQPDLLDPQTNKKEVS